MKCKFCKSELKDGVQKCRFCRMYLDGTENDQPKIECPECGELIIEGAKLCRFCGSEFETVEDESQVRKGKGGKGGKGSELPERGKGSEKSSSYKSFLQTIKDNMVLIILVLLCIWGFKSCDSDTSIQVEEPDLSDKFMVKDSKDAEPSSNKVELGDLTFIPTKDGYQVKGDVVGYEVSCNLDTEDKIKKFVSDMKDGVDSEATGCKFINNKNDDFDDFDIGGNKKVGIFFDNSYAKDGDTKDGPNTRMKDLKQYLNEDRFPDKTVIKFVIPYGNGEEKKGAVLDENEFYKFTIDKSRFDPSDSILDGMINYQLVDKGSSLTYKGGHKILFAYGSKFKFSLNSPEDFFKYDKDGTMCGPESDIDLGGNSGEERKFVCRDAGEVFKKFLALYKKYYQNDDKKHRGHLLLNALKDNRDVFDWDDLYIFSDGEFEIGEAWSLEKTIKYYLYLSRVKESTLSEYPLTNFHVREFKYYGQDSTFIDFWDKTLERVKKEKIKNTCENTKIHLIGFNNGFGWYETKALQKLFDNCEIVENE